MFIWYLISASPAARNIAYQGFTDVHGQYTELEEFLASELLGLLLHTPMTNVDSNAFVSMSSSADQDYPPSNILDPSDNVFWMTTGLYPQEFIITFKEPIECRQLRFVTSNVKRFLMSSTSNQEPKNFETVFEKTLPNNENNLQITDHTLDRSLEVRHFKCVILAGYDSFASVHSLKFDGGNTRMGKKY